MDILECVYFSLSIGSLWLHLGMSNGAFLACPFSTVATLLGALLVSGVVLVRFNIGLAGMSQLLLPTSIGIPTLFNLILLFFAVSPGCRPNSTAPKTEVGFTGPEMAKDAAELCFDLSPFDGALLRRLYCWNHLSIRALSNPSFRAPVSHALLQSAVHRNGSRGKFYRLI